MTTSTSNSTPDLERAYYLSVLTFGVGNGALDPVPGTGIITQPKGDDSLHAYGTVTAPTVGQTLASLATPPFGLYQVKVSIRITTGANPSLADNIEIINTALIKRRVVHGIVGATSTLLLPEYELDFRVDGTQNILVRAVATEAAAVVYAVDLYVRKVAD